MALILKGQASMAMDASFRTFGELNVESAELVFASMEADVLTWSCATADATGAGTVVPEEGQNVELFLDGDRKFKGVVTKVSPQGKSVTCEAQGPWWWMEKILLTGDFDDDEGTSAERSNFVIPTQNLSTSVRDLIDRMITLGVPMTRGTVDASYVCVQQSLPNMSCAAALSQLLLWMPDAVTWFEYANTVPELHVGRRGDLTSLTYQVGVDPVEVGTISIRERTGLRVQRVELNYADRHPVTGRVRYQRQASGAAVTGRVQAITISGPETVAFLPKNDYESYTIRTSTLPPDRDYVVKNDSFLAGVLKEYGKLRGQASIGEVANTVISFHGANRTRVVKNLPKATYIRDNGNQISATGKKLIITASPPQWVLDQYNAVAVTITGSFVSKWKDSVVGDGVGWSEGFQALRNGASYTGSGYEDASIFDNTFEWCARAYNVRGWLIDDAFATNTVIHKPWDYDFITPPADLALNLKDAMNWNPYEGSFTVVAQGAGLFNLVKRKIRLANAKPAFATMDALVKSISYDLMRERLRFTLGPPARTDFGSLIGRIRREPTDNIFYL